MTDPKLILADAMAAHDYAPAYEAYICAALEQTSDVSEAVRIADEAFKRQPKIEAEPQEDDASALFGHDAMESKDASGHEHDQKTGRFGKGSGGKMKKRDIPEPTIDPTDLPSIANKIHEAGQTIHNTFAQPAFTGHPTITHKVYISDLYDAVKNDIKGDVTLTEFKKLMVKMHMEGLIDLSRADINMMDQGTEQETQWVREKIEDSESNQMDATYHSVMIPKLAKPKENP